MQVRHAGVEVQIINILTWGELSA